MENEDAISYTNVGVKKPLHRSLKIIAAQKSTTLVDLVNDALSEFVERAEKPAEPLAQAA